MVKQLSFVSARVIAALTFLGLLWFPASRNAFTPSSFAYRFFHKFCLLYVTSSSRFCCCHYCNVYIFWWFLLSLCLRWHCLVPLSRVLHFTKVYIWGSKMPKQEEIKRPTLVAPCITHTVTQPHWLTLTSTHGNTYAVRFQPNILASSRKKSAQDIGCSSGLPTRHQVHRSLGTRLKMQNFINASILICTHCTRTYCYGHTFISSN